MGLRIRSRGCRAPGGLKGGLAGLALLWSAACSHPQGELIVPAAELPQVVASRYEIQVSDVVEIEFYKPSSLSQTRTVGPDGVVDLALVGRVVAAGRTVEGLAQELRERYAREVVDPEITVSVRDYSRMRIFVGGEVNQPGMLEYRGGMTAVQALVQAGGFKGSASLGSVLLIRKGEDDRPVGSIVDVSAVLGEARFEQDVPLAPSDILFVPRSFIANVNKFVEEYFRNNFPVPVVLGFNTVR